MYTAFKIEAQRNRSSDQFGERDGVENERGVCSSRRLGPRWSEAWSGRRRPLKSSGVSTVLGRGLGGARGVGSFPPRIPSSSLVELLAELDVFEPSGEVLLVGGEGELERRDIVVEPLLIVSLMSGGRTETPSSKVRFDGELMGVKKLLVLLLAR